MQTLKSKIDPQDCVVLFADLQQGIAELGDEFLGALMLRVKSDDLPANDKLELVQSLGHQLTPALRLTFLASEARREAVANAANEERAALARELHDTLLQSFTGAVLQLRALARANLTRKEMTERLSEIERQATEAVQEARAAVGEMRARTALDLTPAVRRFLNSEPHPDTMSLHFEQEGQPRPVSRPSAQAC